MRVDTGRLRVVTHQEAPEPEPAEASEGVPSPGRYIRRQRQRRGMSREQLAAVTNIPRRSIELLEDDRYDELPGQVFAKGFLRCCARSLGLGQERVIELLYERERALLQARRRELRPPPVTADVNLPRSRRELASAPDRPALPPRPPVGQGVLERISSGLSTTNLLLWVVVGLFVAVVVLAAFNMVGGTSVTAPVGPG